VVGAVGDASQVVLDQQRAGVQQGPAAVEQFLGGGVQVAGQRLVGPGEDGLQVGEGGRGAVGAEVAQRGAEQAVLAG
jgi:hypothetical protein